MNNHPGFSVIIQQEKAIYCDPSPFIKASCGKLFLEVVKSLWLSLACNKPI